MGEMNFPPIVTGTSGDAQSVPPADATETTEPVNSDVAPDDPYVPEQEPQATEPAAPYTVSLTAIPTQAENDVAEAEGIDVELYRELKTKGLR